MRADVSAALPGASFAEAWALGLARLRVAHDEGALKSLAVVPSARRRAPGTLLLLASLERFQVNWNRSLAAPG